jgi:serum/glucocorticoid-regulated kinase 2
MLVGIPPFYHPTLPELTLELVLQGQVHLPKNISLSLPCVEMMAKLLTGDPSQRIGYKLDFKEVQSHTWLNDV